MKKTAVDSTAQSILSGYFGDFAEQLTKKVYSKTKIFLNKKAGLEDNLLEPEKISIVGLHHNESDKDIKAEFLVQAHTIDTEGDLVAMQKIFAVKLDKAQKRVAFAQLDLDSGE